ncbi:MAG TPA: CHAD domain-containing protein [Luteibacter sp.]|uniref:CHAD domain-containing protein n=1 Tax=Luteibacter sp. TaxID=1886636 RepID=UPI002CB0F387|nr:CHAD domain-containing protein [Luteibacter sp.]HVI56177.1 CHAD domain-containing protein [Luteibacter sp.]
MPQTPAPSIQAALAALAGRECRGAARALADVKDRHRGIHEARKCLRRLKSLLALGAEPFTDHLPSLNARIGKLATGLSPLRDAHVAVHTAGSLAGPGVSTEWQPAIDALANRRDGRLAAALAKDPRFLKRRHEIRDLGDAIEVLPWKTVTRRSIEQAIARSERRVAGAEKRARKNGSVASLHRWRRRARRLRMQLEGWRKVLKATGKAAHKRSPQDKAAVHAMSKLSDALGAKQDLRALRASLRSLKAPLALDPLLQRVAHELKARRKIG